MNTFTYSGKNRREISFPLGGIGTGCIGLWGNGELGRLEAVNRNGFFAAPKPFFAIKSEKDGKLISAKKLIQDSSENFSNAGVCECFSESDFACSFPFAKLSFKDSNFPCDVTMTAFNPFIPLNGTDSGIPAAFFEFEVCNTGKDALDYTICGVLDNNFNGTCNTAGCTSNGAAYIFMDGRCEMPQASYGNICIATDSKNISFCEYLDSDSESYDAFMSIFTSMPTFNEADSIYKTVQGVCSALAAHFSLNPGERKLIKFLISWYFPYMNTINTSKENTTSDAVRNYYAQYFESSIECTSYCFKHWKRLKDESLIFSKTLLGSTLPVDMLKAVSEGLQELKSPRCQCIDGGLFFGEPLKRWMFSEPLLYLFPSLFWSMLESRFLYAMDGDGKISCELIAPTPKSAVFSSEHNVKQDLEVQLAVIIGVHRFFRLSGNEDGLIESWYYVSKAADCCSEQLKAMLKNGLYNVDDRILFLYLNAMKAAMDIAYTVKDKKRAESYHAVICSFSENVNEKEHICRLMYRHGYAEAALMLCDGKTAEAKELISSLADNGPDMTSYALLCAISGFEYDAYTKQIGFSPLSDYCPLDFGDTFRCFFSVAGGYGYVEEGIDYIEVNMVSGKLDIKSFAVPRTPRLVQYGGRNWRFTDTGLCATLDTNLEVTPDKKLTILIDTKPQK